MKRGGLVIIVVVSAVLVTVLGGNNVGLAQGGASEEAAMLPPYEPVMPLISLMREQDRHFQNILNLIRNEGEDKRMAKLRHEALALAEMGNVNGYHSGSIKHEDYRAWTIELRERAKGLAQAAADEKVDEAKTIAKQINATCNACHDKYQ